MGGEVECGLRTSLCQTSEFVKSCLNIATPATKSDLTILTFEQQTVNNGIPIFTHDLHGGNTFLDRFCANPIEDSASCSQRLVKIQFLAELLREDGLGGGMESTEFWADQEDCTKE